MLNEPPENSDEPARRYPITQAELQEYRRLERTVRRELSILAYQRGQIMAGMGGMDRVEPGWLKPVVVYRSSGKFTLDDDGEQVEIVERHLAIVEEACSPPGTATS